MCISFQHLTSVFLLHGFDTLELFSDLNKTDLDELEIKNPEERAKLLTAAQMLWDYEGTSCKILRTIFILRIIIVK